MLVTVGVRRSPSCLRGIPWSARFDAARWRMCFQWGWWSAGASNAQQGSRKTPAAPAVLRQATHRLVVLDGVGLDKGVESGVGVVLRLGHPDVLESALGLRLLALRQHIEHVGRLVHPAALTAGLGPHLLDGLPEAERAVGNRELRPDHQPAPL